ncbi:hypothetical protein TrST_g4168 [Triparma strigata]|uniref:Uncharacterized protein n=1 Tax=Triparma strigata TaxID=1606541 RepID=A0A9W7F0H1_9STRA|nr:hypothetical protein TrST_g4168 [Triparma strigata]
MKASHQSTPHADDKQRIIEDSTEEEACLRRELAEERAQIGREREELQKEMDSLKEKTAALREEIAALTTPVQPSCGYPGCSKPAPLKCSRCREVRYCSKEHQTMHWKFHKKLCAPPGEKISWPAAPTPAPPAGPIAAKAAPPIVTPIAAPGSFAAPAVSAPVKNVEEEDDSDKCIICMDRVVNVKFKGCSHSMTCRECTDETIRRGQPCPLCRKPISGYEVGKFIDSIGAHGLWPTSLKNLTQLASGEGFNEYFQDLFVGNEASYLRWKEMFDVLEIVGVGAEGGGESLEQQVLKITGSEDMEKLRALAKLCSLEFFNDPSLLVAVSRRILEVLGLAYLAAVEEKKVRGKKKKGKKKVADPKKLCWWKGWGERWGRRML